MPENLQPQPWWVAVIGGVLFTVRWLIGLGASGARATIEAQKETLARLNARVDKLEQREDENLTVIQELRTQNAMLRNALCRAGIHVPDRPEYTDQLKDWNEGFTGNRYGVAAS
ncbi:hypothetical protein HW511_11980 [Asaia siamensis]|uniref:Uncharacterized protein n=1 Tax=Asaia siamensis TaxID=110479 RepID=A0ABQ1MHP7_9PROT|nr:hypothetical protein [Asaia siamensis]GBR07270.1 hypothetical protein AA0323_1732 [Asaia siamensis NRIC 0323]GGC37631.1 hypothetical protein GCM10007207_23940 [Asaia siamensis]